MVDQSSGGMNTPNSSDSQWWRTAFKQKTQFIKTWKPGSTPSNRDRLELYALQKQALQGDAPRGSAVSSSPAEQAKLNAWKQKAGLTPEEAMRQYCQEADRQVRVYGQSAAVVPTTDGATISHHTTTANSTASTAPPVRGLAAIPLLCAAAAEKRTAYLHRLSQTPHRAWWKRQEPLTAVPGSLWALPEHALLWWATALESWSLHPPISPTILPHAVWQSYWWPLHNTCLALWMGYLVVALAWGVAWQSCLTLLLGSRRTGYALPSLWSDVIVFLGQSCQSLTEAHQPLSARLMGLGVFPLSCLISLLESMVAVVSSSATNSTSSSSSSSSSSSLPMVLATGAYVTALAVTWWYWFLVLPWWGGVWIGACLLVVGQCYALIELAGV